MLRTPTAEMRRKAAAMAMALAVLSIPFRDSMLSVAPGVQEALGTRDAGQIKGIAWSLFQYHLLACCGVNGTN
jgi:hypothetical protein